MSVDEDQKYLLDVMQEQFFTINKSGIHAKVEAPTVIIASANPVRGDWSIRDHNTGEVIVGAEDFPMSAALLDRFSLVIIFEDPRNEDEIRSFADLKFKQTDRKIPDYSEYLKRHIKYAKRFSPKLSYEAEFMLKVICGGSIQT